MRSLTRRSFVRHSGLGLLTFWIGGCEVKMTPREAHELGADMRVLTRAEVASLEEFGETLLPGSRAAGIANYIDHQLAEPADRQLLMIKYLGVNPPFLPFYREGVAALGRAARAAHQLDFHELGAARQRELVSQVSRENPPGWGGGPPAPFYFFVVRADALDVTYGTMEGFEALGIPYMAHIEPPGRWGE
jgi:hypothetical protein